MSVLSNRGNSVRGGEGAPRKTSIDLLTISIDIYIILIISNQITNKCCFF